MSSPATPSGAASDAMFAIAVRAARTAGSILVDAARDLARLPTFSKEHAQVTSGALSYAVLVLGAAAAAVGVSLIQAVSGLVLVVVAIAMTRTTGISNLR